MKKQPDLVEASDGLVVRFDGEDGGHDINVVGSQRFGYKEVCDHNVAVAFV